MSLDSLRGALGETWRPLPYGDWLYLPAGMVFVCHDRLTGFTEVRAYMLRRYLKECGYKIPESLWGTYYLPVASVEEAKATVEKILVGVVEGATDES